MANLLVRFRVYNYETMEDEKIDMNKIKIGDVVVLFCVIYLAILIVTFPKEEQPIKTTCVEEQEIKVEVPCIALLEQYNFLLENKIELLNNDEKVEEENNTNEDKIANDEPFIDDDLYQYIIDVCDDYDISPELICSVIWHESRWKNVNNGDCIGLMQISSKWHEDRMNKLGVTDLSEPKQNILVGIDFLAELFEDYEDPYLVLMLYNMKRSTAFKNYNEGRFSKYAISVMEVSLEFYEEYKLKEEN